MLERRRIKSRVSLVLPPNFRMEALSELSRRFSGLPGQCYCISLSAGLALCVYAQSSGCSAAVFLRKMAFLR